MLGSVVEQLGLPSGTRAAIVHADDIGMCHAANVAFWEVQAFGIVTSGSVMMPCPWVPEMAAWCRDHPEADVGVHLTLTSEWEGYRWRPISTCDPASGLVDEQGYMWRSVEALHRHMDPDAAAAELRAQVAFALELGIDVTHIDTHMGAVAHPELALAYTALMREYRIPAMLPRLSASELQARRIDEPTGRMMAQAREGLAASGAPVVDRVADLAVGHELEAYQQGFARLSPGLSHAIVHPAAPGYEAEVITRSAPQRMADYRMMLNPRLKAWLAEQGIRLIGYRQLRNLMRGN
ncbi:MAG: polysaccharide deacetylase family protein [Anaerolineae bacterium]